MTNLANGDTPPDKDRDHLASPLPAAWRWGFPAFLVVALIWAGVLLVDGLSTVLDSESGETREAETDPSAPGFEAFVEQTWSMLVATEDDDGELVQVAVVTTADRTGGGGTILLVPPEVRAQGCEVSPCRLVERHREGGVDHVRETVTGMLEVEVTAAVLMTPDRWTSLAGPAGPVSVDLPIDLVVTASDGTSVVRFPAGRVDVAPSDVVDLLAFPDDADGLGRLERQSTWWTAWLMRVGAGDPLERLPNLELDLVDLMASVAGGSVRLVAPSWVVVGTDLGSQLIADEAALADLVVQMFPFPIPLVPGQRPTVRLLNGTGDPSFDAPARERVLRAGVDLAVVGNYRHDGVIQTRVVYRDPILAGAANDLAASLGGGVLFDENISPVADLTVVIGADFRPAG
ncbi:MAG: LytR C-terminal domain-containing protein [Acidimicrobiales bacterium]|nr:LytR C-terminal domain-containing protein [Acidimicrobiales bacterium]